MRLLGANKTYKQSHLFKVLVNGQSGNKIAPTDKRFHQSVDY